MLAIKTEFPIKYKDNLIGEIKVYHTMNKVTVTHSIKLKKNIFRLILKELDKIKNINTYEIQMLNLSCF